MLQEKLEMKIKMIVEIEVEFDVNYNPGTNNSDDPEDAVVIDHNIDNTMVAKILNEYDAEILARSRIQYAIEKAEREFNAAMDFHEEKKIS